MLVSDIILILISGLGVIHGLFLSIFLWNYGKGNSLSNKILSLLLGVLSFRIGKSVILEFADNIDVKLIFIGLGTIMAIGPLYYLFTLSATNKSFQIKNIHLIQFLPMILGVCFGFWINESDTESIPKWIFACIFLSYYAHFMAYLLICFGYTSKRKTEISQDSYKLLMLFFYSLLIIWVVYFLNLVDEVVPYIVGPLLYSVVAYTVSFIVISNGYLEKIDFNKYKTTPVSDEQVDTVYAKVLKIIQEDSQYKNSEISLKLISETVHVSTQVLSMVINQKSKINFNSFINSFRIKEATKLFESPKNAHLTIAAIAFEVGFNSISSFNTAFKKQIGQTPQVYRKQFSH